ncbi:MAG: 50S ribosomal protein L23 [Erysipelotrichaceae bacterium]|nr:50S ribosomal protein L23 [Erysipelotrichaceae bacterium]MBQ6494201.1 50S ribosomal protein L23 [Erysipelotrichaceae bacterium]
MSNARDIIVRPLVTEKTIKAQESDNTVVFEVAKGTNKIQIRQAVEEIFNVKVASVNLVNQKPKTKRMGRYVGKTNHLRKAYVKLKDGYKIDILADK